MALRWRHDCWQGQTHCASGLMGMGVDAYSCAAHVVACCAKVTAPSMQHAAASSDCAIGCLWKVVKAMSPLLQRQRSPGSRLWPAEGAQSCHPQQCASINEAAADEAAAAEAAALMQHVSGRMTGLSVAVC